MKGISLYKSSNCNYRCSFKGLYHALYSGKRLDDTEDNHSSSIEVYTWSGKPVQLLNLDIPIAYFAVDEQSRVIYAANPEIYEDKLLKYSMN